MPELDLEHYRSLVEQGPAMMWRAQLDGARDYFSPAWLAFTGRTLDQERGDAWLEGVHPDDRESCRAGLTEHMARREAFTLELRLRRSDGRYVPVIDRGQPYKDASGALQGFSGSCVPVDDRRSADGAFGLSDFFEMSLDNVCVAGLDGYFKKVNPSWTKTLGWSTEELLSRPLLEFVHPDDRAATLDSRKRLRAASTLSHFSNRYLCKDGTCRWFEWRSAADVERGLVYAVARDITEQRLAEERLVDAQRYQEKLQRQLIFADRMASIGTLASGVAHEINNPLAAVMMNVGLMLETLGAGDPASLADERAYLQEMAKDAQEGAERIRKIVRGLKTFSRAEGERRSVIEVVPLLELSIDMTFREVRHRARLVRDYGPIPPVEADDARLGQVFLNLLMNAAQALEEGAADANEIRIVTSTDDAGRAVIEFRDTGPGIPADVRARIFDPFFTTKPVGVGTGLGLSICHTIVSGMAGEIEVVSEEGRGTRVIVVLPAASGAATAATAKPAAEERSMAGAAILVVDDERAIGTVLRRVLGDHEVTAVTSARQALEKLRAGKRFDVIFTDLMMPEMSGMELYEELERSFPHVVERVVLISGGAFTPAARAFLERVSNERISKPFFPQQLRELVQRRLNEQRQKGASPVGATGS